MNTVKWPAYSKWVESKWPRVGNTGTNMLALYTTIAGEAAKFARLYEEALRADLVSSAKTLSGLADMIHPIGVLCAITKGPAKLMGPLVEDPYAGPPNPPDTGTSFNSCLLKSLRITQIAVAGGLAAKTFVGINEWRTANRGRGQWLRRLHSELTLQGQHTLDEVLDASVLKLAEYKGDVP